MGGGGIEVHRRTVSGSPGRLGRGIPGGRGGRAPWERPRRPPPAIAGGRRAGAASRGAGEPFALLPPRRGRG